MPFRLLTGILLIASLAGCQQHATADDHKPTTDYAVDYQVNAQIPDDRTLLQSGDTIQAEKGFMTLQQANFKPQTIDVGDIRITIHDVKTIALEPDYSMVDYFHQLTSDTTFDIVKAFVTVENTAQHVRYFSPVATLQAASGTQTFERDIYLDALNGKLAPGEKKQGNIGYIIHDGDTSWTVTTSAVFDAHEKELTTPATYTLKP
ncbi:DUF4352 domain-containing protein [Kurthia huakuii]|uniref:DUF4352 domain-containing protein n=1 Tax=Kurthia huakuii TaxID=1421019 RepID=UPI0004951812|nr:DUF4352 domain-containing protein [Kurthia huakuii]MBM7699264.1 hypothetical protein [Kurthia huakuii]